MLITAVAEVIAALSWWSSSLSKSGVLTCCFPLHQWFVFLSIAGRVYRDLLLSVSLTELTPSEVTVGHKVPPPFMLSAGYCSVFCFGG